MPLVHPCTVGLACVLPSIFHETNQEERMALPASQSACSAAAKCMPACTALPVQDMVRDSGAIIFIYPKADTSGCTFQAGT